MLAVAFDHAGRQAMNPDSLAQEHCGGTLGGGAPASPDTGDCYNAAIARTPVEAAGWWLVGGIAGVVVLAGSVMCRPHGHDLPIETLPLESD
jgi:hypothetical protein